MWAVIVVLVLSGLVVAVAAFTVVMFNLMEDPSPPDDR